MSRAALDSNRRPFGYLCWLCGQPVIVLRHGDIAVHWSNAQAETCRATGYPSR